MNSFTIKDLENLSGIKAHTIRIWEQRYNFLKPCRTCTNIRYYSNDELKKILNIALLNRNGYKISHLDKMCEDELNEKILALSQQEAKQEKTICELVRCMIDLKIDVLEKQLDNYIAAKGIEKTAIEVIFPFLQKIGILWTTNQINPAQEHLVSNIIRKKIILAIEGIKNPVKPAATALLFLPEGEFHELGLLFVYYLLKKQGVSVIYLGPNTQMSDVEYVFKHKKIDYIYSHLTCLNAGFDLDDFVSAVAKRFAKSKIIISGKPVIEYEKKIPSPVKFKTSIAEVIEFISDL